MFRRPTRGSSRCMARRNKFAFDGAAQVIMFPPWRFKLREAQVALEQGRLNEAAQIAAQPQLTGYLPVQNLLAQIGEQLAQRALERAAAGDFTAGWRDLDEARRLAGETANWQ